ncbi:MAG: D-alanine--D-alanine ligase [Erysipelotrichales bacterium]|nr:D-alanine--D-alanine ligase [Erysipelotrichales bacterium]
MKLKVGVMFGGESVEHEISIISAAQAMAAIDRDKYEVYPIYITKDRLFYSGDVLFDMDIYKDLKALEKKATQVTFYRKGNGVVMSNINRGLFAKETNIDVAVLVMHGTNGEDGALQGYLETLKLPYSGSDVIASAVGQDKVIMKHILENSGLPLTRWFWLYSNDFTKDKDMYVEKAKDLGFPVIIKPACLGSSIGITTAHNEDEFVSAIKESSQYDRKLVVEKMVRELKEVNASVLGNATKHKVSVLEEVYKADNEDILSFDKKYTAGNGKMGAKGGNTKGSGASKGMASTARIIPANISDAATTYITQLASDTFKALGSSGVCRIDFMIDGESNDIYVNEINSIPGSLAFYLWEKSGVNFTELMDTLIKLAIDRKRDQEKMIFSYDTNVLSGFKSDSFGNKKR